jgi:hypothetical protein
MRTAKFAAIAVLGFAVSISIILNHSPSEPEEPEEPLSSAAERQAFEVVLLRTTAKYRIARDVIAGRLSLFEAAALFGALNRVPPQWQSASYRFRFPEDTDELLCRQVLGYVSCELDVGPDRRDAAMVRLEVDFNGELPNNGATRLPNLLTLVPVEKLLTQARDELTYQGILPLRAKKTPGDPLRVRKAS